MAVRRPYFRKSMRVQTSGSHDLKVPRAPVWTEISPAPQQSVGTKAFGEHNSHFNQIMSISTHRGRSKVSSHRAEMLA